MSLTQVAPPRTSTRPRVLRRLPIVGLLAVLAALLLYEVKHTGITADEPNHILGAHFYWHGYKQFPLADLAPLLKIVSGWEPTALGLPMPSAADPQWKPGAEWSLAAHWSGNLKDPYYQSLTWDTRLPVLIFPLALAALVWFWARKEWGPAAGLIAAAILVAEPTLLGHAALVKNDVASALAYALFWFAAWRFWQRPFLPNAAWLAAATAFGIAAKLSLLILAGLGPLVLLLRAPKRAWAYLPTFFGVLYIGLYLVYQGDARPLHPDESQAVIDHAKSPIWFVWAAHLFRWVPISENLWSGCVSLILSSADGTPVYLWGQTYPGGTPWYFLAALAVKVPLGFQALFLGAGAWAAWRILRDRDPLPAFLLFPPILYIGLASLSPFQLGIRLILPALPFGALLAAAAWPHWRRSVLVATTAGALEAMASYPHGLSFFNAWVGGPTHGSQYLVDSNLDWGQDLPQLKTWVAQHPDTRVRLTYFGMESPWRYFTDKEVLVDPPPWGKELAAGRTELTPEPAVYAISASVLPGQYFAPEYRDFYRHFRHRTPTAHAGYSILIYDLRSIRTDTSKQTATAANPPESH